MNSAEIMAVGKVVGNTTKQFKDARKTVEVGEHTIDVTVRVKGTLKVAEDYEQVCHMDANAWALLHKALSKLNGVTIKSLVAEDEPDAEQLTKIKEEAKEATKELKEKYNKTHKGKVTHKLTVEKVESTVEEVKSTLAVEEASQV